MREQISEALSMLIGKPMWSAGRAADLHWFSFGEKRTVSDRKGNLREVGEYALHIACAWRLCTNDYVIVASRDRYFPPKGIKDILSDFNWDAMPQNNRFDHRMREFLSEHASQQIIVKEIEIGTAMSAKIVFIDGFILEIFPDDSLDDENSEHWRLFQPYTDNKHFVVAGYGIEP